MRYLIYKFGEKNVNPKISIIEPEIDVKLYDNPISIKTITGKSIGGVKLIWTVDTQKAKEFCENYYPHYDILLIHINWGNYGGLYHIPLEAQQKLFDKVGKEGYIKLPKPGTNPRGVEITKNALANLATHRLTKVVKISWEKTDIEYDPYRRWVDYWREE